MNKDQLIQYLYAMEKQTREIENQNSRLRSISESMKKLEQELAPPKKPVFSEPKQVKDFDWFSAIIAWMVECLVLCIGLLSVLSEPPPDVVFEFLLLLSFVCAGYVGKLVGKKDKQAAEEEATLQMKKALKHWDAQMRHYEERKQQIPSDMEKLRSDSRIAEQAQRQAQSKLTEYGNAIGLHSYYWTTHALHEIWTLLDRGRADTLKEAINRYETDESQRKHNDKMAYYASEQADAERRRAQAAEAQAEYARQQAAYSEQQSEYARQQAENTEAVRKDVAKMRSDQEWDRILNR